MKDKSSKPKKNYLDKYKIYLENKKKYNPLHIFKFTNLLKLPCPLLKKFIFDRI